MAHISDDSYKNFNFDTIDKSPFTQYSHGVKKDFFAPWYSVADRHFAYLSNTLLEDEGSARDTGVITFLPNIYRFKKKSLTDSAINLS